MTLGRMFTDSAGGIAPGSVPGFVLAQLVGAVAGSALVTALFGRPARTAVLPDDARELIAG